MRPFAALVHVLAVGCSAALLAGCDPTSPQSQSNVPAPSTDLESQYGGYTMSDEPVAFADPEIRRLEELEAMLQPILVDGDSTPGDSTFVVRVVWGQLRGNRDATVAVDWTGSVAIDRGGLVLLRTIAFEGPRDHIVRPRPDRQTLGFVSHTLPHHDGLLLLVHEAPGDAPTTFSFRTGPYTNTWSLADLAAEGVVVPVDDHGNAVSIEVLPFRPRACPSGFARGGWQQGEAEGERGVLRGLWLSNRGDIIGHLRGHFGVNNSGERVWFAKILGPTGRARGLARGTWAPNDDPNVPGGHFVGHFTSRSGAGRIEGRILPGRGDATGMFEARWEEDCTRPGTPQRATLDPRADERRTDERL